MRTAARKPSRYSIKKAAGVAQLTSTEPSGLPCMGSQAAAISGPDQRPPPTAPHTRSPPRQPPPHLARPHPPPPRGGALDHARERLQCVEAIGLQATVADRDRFLDR